MQRERHVGVEQSDEQHEKPLRNVHHAKISGHRPNVQPIRQQRVQTGKSDG